MDSPSMPFGQRLRAHRERAGKTRAVLGGLVGRSEEWVKALENGRLLTPRLPVLVRLAEVLDIDDLAELTGDQSVPVATVSKASHEATPKVATAIRRYAGSVDAPPSSETLTGRVDQGWHLWHRSDRERSTIASVLPELLTTTRAAARSHDGLERRHTLAQLARVYHLCQLFAAHQPVAELVWLSADRAMSAAQDADDPQAIAAAAWYYAHVYRAGGQLEEAAQVVQDAVELLSPEQDLPLWGKLHLGQALTAAKSGEEGRAWRMWDTASQAANSLGADYVHPWLLFGRAEVDAYALTIEVDLCHGGSAIQRACSYDHSVLPSRTRRAAWLIEASRAHQLRNEPVAMIHMLQWALRESTETVRHSNFARTVSLELSEQRGPVGADARELALAIGTIR